MENFCILSKAEAENTNKWIWNWRLVDTEANVTLISAKSKHQYWPLQEVNIQLQGTGSSQVKQGVRWIKCIGTEGQIGKLKPYVTAMNFWGHDLSEY